MANFFWDDLPMDRFLGYSTFRPLDIHQSQVLTVLTCDFLIKMGMLAATGQNTKELFGTSPPESVWWRKKHQKW